MAENEEMATPEEVSDHQNSPDTSITITLDVGMVIEVSGQSGIEEGAPSTSTQLKFDDSECTQNL